MSPQENACSCAKCDMERIPRTGWVRLLPLMGLYECGECGIRELALRAKVKRDRRHVMGAPFMPHSAATASLSQPAATTANAVIETRVPLK